MWPSCSAQQAWPLASRISRQNHILFWRGLVRPDHRNALERRRWPKSFRRASMRSRFRMWASCSGQRERPLDSCVSKPRPFRPRIGAQGPPRCPIDMAMAEIAPLSESAKPISKEGLHPWSAGSIPRHSCHHSQPCLPCILTLTGADCHCRERERVTTPGEKESTLGETVAV